jgi:hypothetical protein
MEILIFTTAAGEDMECTTVNQSSVLLNNVLNLLTLIAEQVTTDSTTAGSQLSVSAM